MPGFSVQILQDQITPKLIGLTGKMQQGVVKAWDEVGPSLVELARSIVPVRTGFLRDSIYYAVGQAEGGTPGLQFGASAEYAFWVEMGTRRMRAQPFIRPSLEAYQQKLLDAILQGVLDAFG